MFPFPLDHGFLLNRKLLWIEKEDFWSASKDIISVIFCFPSTAKDFILIGRNNLCFTLAAAIFFLNIFSNKGRLSAQSYVILKPAHTGNKGFKRKHIFLA